jgi:lysozyme
LVAPYKENISLPIYYDLEEQGTEQGAKERAEIFGDIIEKAGFWCGIYASLSWWQTHLSGLDRFTKWVAAWGVNNGRPNSKPNIQGVDMWQYTSVGRVDGIRGHVDLNELLKPSIGGYIKANKPNTSVKPSAPIKEDPKPQVEKPKYTTYKIQKGDTLSKIAKKFNTTVKAIKAANPDKIKDVNKIYAGDTIKIPE